MKKETIFGLIGAGLAGVASILVGYKVSHAHEPYDLTNVGTCEKCRNCITARFMYKWVTHLIKDHGCTDKQAQEALDKAYWKNRRRP